MQAQGGSRARSAFRRGARCLSERVKLRKGTKKHLLDERRLRKITIFAKDMRRPGVRGISRTGLRSGPCCVRCREQIRLYDYTRYDPQTRDCGTGGVRRIRRSSVYGRGGTALRHAALRPVVARQRHPAAAGAVVGRDEFAGGGGGQGAPGPSGSHARGDDSRGVADSRRRDRRSRHAPRQAVGQCALAVAQGGDSGRLHSGPQPEHRPDERSVRSGDARLRVDGGALRRRGAAKRVRRKAYHDAAGVPRRRV